MMRVVPGLLVSGLLQALSRITEHIATVSLWNVSRNNYPPLNLSHSLPPGNGLDGGSYSLTSTFIPNGQSREVLSQGKQIPDRS